MPRKLIIKKEDIWRRRAQNYAHYFDMHKRAMQEDDHTRRLIIEALQELPKPSVDIYGDIHRNFAWRVDIHQQFKLRFPEEFAGLNDQIIFFWSTEQWQEYVTAFNALPEPITNYEMKYSKRTDTVYYEPLAYLLPVDNSRTSSVQVESNPGTSRVKGG